MSLDRVIKALIDLGLSRSDAEIYVYIAKKGPKTVVNLDKVLQYSKNQIYSSIRSLVTKNIIQKCGKKYSAVSFEKALDLLITKEKEQAQAMYEIRELLTTWETKD